MVNTAEGAALLAGVGANTWPDVEAACATTIHVTGSTVPKSESVERYADFYQLYGQLYLALRPTFVNLASF